MRLALFGLSVGTSMLLSVAASAQAVVLTEDGSVTIEFGESSLLLPAHPHGAIPTVATFVGDQEHVHVTFEVGERLPDTPYSEWLVDAASGEVVADWTTQEPTRIRGFDLDGDGNQELVRDYARPTPCGLFVWWAPAVLGADGFEDVIITPRTDEAVHSGRVSPPRPGVQGGLVASCGDLAGEIGALFDNDSATAWRSVRVGTGAWVAVEAPHGARVGGIRLATDPFEQPLTVQVRFEDGASAVLEVDGLLREFAIDTDSRCAIITAADLGGRESMWLTEASLVTSTDTLSPTDLVSTFWGPALTAACANDDRDPRRPAQIAVGLNSTAAAELLHATESPCEALALAQAMNSVDASGALRLPTGAGPIALEAAHNSLFGRNALPRLAELRAESADWTAALRAAAADTGDPVELGLLMRAGVSDEAIFEDALFVASQAEPIALQSLVGDSADAETWQRALRIALATGGECEADSRALTTALEADNGTVARLALRLVGERRCSSFRAMAGVIAEDDPSPFLRAEALRTLDALGAPVCARPLDEAASVRVVQSGLSCTDPTLRQTPETLVRALSGETWPAVRAAWIRAAIAVDDETVDAQLMHHLFESSSEEDLVAAFVAIRVRGTRVPTEALDLMIAHESSRSVLDAGIGVLRFAEELPILWLQGIQAAGGYTERLQPTIDALLD